MQEVKAAERRSTVEDLLYASVLEKFAGVGVPTMPRIESVPESAATLAALTEGVHSAEAIDLVKEHIMATMGPASVAYSNSMIRMSRLQAAQVRC